jgi:HK97 family phage major capsid protein
MRDDEIKELQEQKKALIVELRTHSAAADSFQRENNLDEWRAEDTEKFGKIEKTLLGINSRLEMEYRTTALARFDPAESVHIPMDGAPKTLEEFRTANAPQRVVDAPDVRSAIFSWIVKGRDGLEAEEYRVLSKAASGGGFFVPTELADLVVRAMRFLPGGVGSLARTLQTSTGDAMNVALNLTHGSAAWIAESGSYTPSDETMTQAQLAAYKAGTKIIVSEELLTDSAFDLTSFITTEFGERIGALAESAYILGDGSGKPTGILDAASAVSVVTLPAGQVTTLTYAALAAAVFAVPAQYREGMAILASDSLWVRLVTLTDTTGRPVWNPSVAAGAPDTFAGIPIYTHPNLAASGANAKSMVVGNFNRGYWIRRVNGVYMQRQNELHSDSGQVGFRGYLRLDGKVVLPDALRVIAFAAT